jgi:YfiH family protein
VATVPHEAVPGFARLGLTAFTTTRDAGSFNLGGAEPAAEVFGRWWALRAQLAPRAVRLASAHQVHGTEILVHHGDWEGWLRAPAADGHITFTPGTAMVVSLADCVPVFIGHPSGAAGVVHAGWRGTAAGILPGAIAGFTSRGLRAGDLVVHLGPAICGGCYEVGVDVYAQLTGTAPDAPRTIDLRALLARAAREAGVRQITTSDSCTRCHNARFFSHRCGDSGRQLGVIVAPRA